MTRREFIAAGLTGIAGLYVSAGVAGPEEFAPETPLLDEDGYKLWLRYAPPGEAAKDYRRTVRQIRVEGDSATCRIIRDELRMATTHMLVTPIQARDTGVAEGLVVVGTPKNSTLVRAL